MLGKLKLSIVKFHMLKMDSKNSKAIRSKFSKNYAISLIFCVTSKPTDRRKKKLRVLAQVPTSVQTIVRNLPKVHLYPLLKST